MKPYNGDLHAKRLLRWALIGTTCFVLAIVWASLRTSPHIASYNIVFNFGVFFPLLSIASLISYFVAGQILLNWNRIKLLKLKLISLALSLFVITTTIYFIMSPLRRH
jgi:hypothetical protein